MRQDERRFVLDIQIAGQREGGLAFDLVHEDARRRQIGAERHLVESEQGGAGDAEIRAARFAAEPERTERAATLIDGQAPTLRAVRLTVIPTERPEQRLGFHVAHVEDGCQGEGPGFG
jgi:hypothetical protein